MVGRFVKCYDSQGLLFPFDEYVRDLAIRVLLRIHVQILEQHIRLVVLLSSPLLTQINGNLCSLVTPQIAFEGNPVSIARLTIMATDDVINPRIRVGSESGCMFLSLVFILRVSVPF